MSPFEKTLIYIITFVFCHSIKAQYYIEFAKKIRYHMDLDNKKFVFAP
jgi:hypothetical protein